MKLEVCILAGGLSTRMGRDKARLRFGGKTMLSMVRAAARGLGCPIRVIRRDVVPRCGPLGGVLTALRTTRADAVLFMACDMPLVSAALLRKLVRAGGKGTFSVFGLRRGTVGFPFLVPRSALGTASSQMAQGAFSLREFAASLKARTVAFPRGSREWINVNAPADCALVRRLLGRNEKRRPLVTQARRTYGSRHAKPPDSTLRPRESSRGKRPR